jgi:formylglycine-generating enzyme required for sulfatase activity
MSLRAYAVIGVVALAATSCQQSRLSRVERVRWASGPDSAITVSFTVSWANASRDGEEYDALWLFGKYRLGEEAWRHLFLERARVDRADLQLAMSDDSTGAMLRRGGDARGEVTAAVTFSAQAYRTGRARDRLEVRVFSLDMRHIPSGAFFVGDGEIANLTGHFQTGGLTTPYRIGGPDSIVLGSDTSRTLANSNAYGMTGDGGDPETPPFSSDDFTATDRLTLSPLFPNGYAAFYVMTYELSQSQYAGFLNTLTEPQARARHPAPGRFQSRARYAVTGTRPFTAVVPDRAATLVSWMDLAAYADWAGLRPMTELEYEKAARGPERPIPGEFAWGTPEVHSGRYSLVHADTPDERVANPAARTPNASYDATHGVATAACASCIKGPVPVDAFPNGASRYGVYHMSGNVFERVVSIGHVAGRRFDGTHGDGTLDTDGQATGPEVSNWPGVTSSEGGTEPTFRITTALGSGSRGGSWASSEPRLRISDRALAATSDATRRATYGALLVRTAATINP